MLSLLVNGAVFTRFVFSHLPRRMAVRCSWKNVGEVVALLKEMGVLPMASSLRWGGICPKCCLKAWCLVLWSPRIHPGCLPAAGAGCPMEVHILPLTAEGQLTPGSSHLNGTWVRGVLLPPAGARSSKQMYPLRLCLGDLHTTQQVKSLYYLKNL